MHIFSGLNLLSWSTVVMLASWLGVPELYVVANVELHSSKYHGFRPPCVADEMDKVYGEFVYPSQLQLSVFRPPFPEAHTNMEPLPPRPSLIPLVNAFLARGPGPSTVFPSSSGPQEAEYMSIC